METGKRSIRRASGTNGRYHPKKDKRRWFDEEYSLEKEHLDLKEQNMTFQRRAHATYTNKIRIKQKIV